MSEEYRYQLSIKLGPLVGGTSKGDRREPAAMLNIRAETAETFHGALEGLMGGDFEQAILDVTKKYGGALSGAFPPAPQFTAHEPSPAANVGGFPATPPAAGPRLDEQRLSIQYLDVKPSTKGGTQWTVKFPNGTRASTFKAEHGAVLETAKRTGSEILVSFYQKGQYTNIGSVRLAQ